MTPPTGPSPVTAPPQEGVRAQAQVRLKDVVKGLVDVVAMLKAEMNSDVAKAALKALNTLAPFTPEVAEGLSQAEAMSALARSKAVQPGGGQSNMLGIPAPRPNVMAGAPMGGIR